MSAGLASVRVHTDAPYDVVIGRGARTALPGMPEICTGRVAVLHPAALRTVAEQLSADLRAAGAEAHRVELPDGERAKSIEVAASSWSAMARMRLGRGDTVVGVGGGATTDLAGFVAANWLRGVRVVHLPTTLLGMVDAAVGGKAAINIAEGKNLVGAFHEPAGVLCDLDFLTTLPRSELVSGLAEVVKCGFLADPGILDLVEASPAAAVSPGGDVLPELVERAVRVKARVVAADLRETPSERVGREALNYGHTLGHAIEAVERYRFRHGDAVAIGMVYAAELARRSGRLDAGTAGRHRSVLASLGLPTGYRGDRWDELLQAMRLDKKSRADQLRFVVLEGLARPGILADPAPGLLADAYAAISAPTP